MNNLFKEIFVVDGLAFELKRSEKRKTIGISIERNGELVISAPVTCLPATLERAVRSKYRWIYGKIAEKEMLFRLTEEKEFVDGESFAYLGRNYRLRIVEGQECEAVLCLQNDWFLLKQEGVQKAQEHFVRWYCEQGQEWIEKRVELFTSFVGMKPKAIQVRELGFRWGSCSQSETLNFHWRTTRLPPWAIDYVIVHELVHLREPHHNEKFWQEVEIVMPDYAERKQWLEENGSSF